MVCSTVGDLSLDEMTPCGPTEVVEVTPAGTRRYKFYPKVGPGLPNIARRDIQRIL